MRCFAEHMQSRNSFGPWLEIDAQVVDDVTGCDLPYKLKIREKDASFLEEEQVVTFRNPMFEDVFAERDEIKRICRMVDTDSIVADRTHPVAEFSVVRVIIRGLLDTIHDSPERR